jgi:predicted  nucleic acid-binding Zn-ribbon protein
MATELGTLLAEIHRLRIFIRDLQAEIERGPRVLKAHQTKLQKQEAGLKLAHDELKKLQVTFKEKELSTKTAYQQLARYETQLNEASEQKQMDALSHQITHTKQTIATTEEESILLISEIEERQAKIPELDAALKKAQADFVTYQAEGKDRLARLQADLKKSTGELTVEEKKLDPLIRPLYDRLVKAFSAECVVPLENSACSFCHTSVTQQFIHDITAGKFTVCPNCGRGLYIK